MPLFFLLKIKPLCDLFCLWVNNQVASILEDEMKDMLRAPSNSKKHERTGLVEILKQKNVQFVSFSGWEKIDSRKRWQGS